jgi:hypothetical protein
VWALAELNSKLPDTATNNINQTMDLANNLLTDRHVFHVSHEAVFAFVYADSLACSGRSLARRRE